ncbi:MAG: AI-2E family transporter [Dehalococcoidia bacterium]
MTREGKLLPRGRRATSPATRARSHRYRPRTPPAETELNEEILTRDSLQLAPITRLLIGGAAAVVLVAGMRFAAPLLVPFILTGMVVLATTPTLIDLQRRGIPPRLAVLGVYAVLVIVGLLLLLYFALLLHRFTDNLPDYAAELDARLAGLEEALASIGLPAPNGRAGSNAIIEIANWVAEQLLTTVQIAVFVFPAAMLLLLESPRLLAGLPREIGTDDRLARTIGDFRDGIVGFLEISTRTGVILAIGVAVMLFVLGVDFPVFFGLLTFFANYIPSIGLLLAAVPAIGMAWVQYGWGRAVLVMLGFILLGMVVGSTMQRSLLRRRLNLSSGTIFLGAFFWAWVLGPAGALIGAPIMALIKVILESSPRTRWIATLMSQGQPAPAREERRTG